MAFQVYTQLMTYVDNTANNYISSTVTAVAGAITPAVITLLGVYVLLWGFAYLRGMIQEPIIDVVTRVAKLCFILGIGLGLANYANYVTDTVYNSPQQLAQAMTNGGATAAQTSLDTILENVFKIGDKFWDDAGVMSGNFGFYIVALLVWVFGIIVTAFSAALIVLSKVALAIVIALGPIFIISLLFQPTARFFESWVAQLANYWLVGVLVVAVNLFMFKLVGAAAQNVIDGNEYQIKQIFPFFVTCVISILVLAQVLSIASGLAGGISLSSMGLGRFALRGAYQTAKDAGRKAGAPAKRAAQKFAKRRWESYKKSRTGNRIEKK